MDNLSVKEIIIKRFDAAKGTAIIPLMRKSCMFMATYNDEGIIVSNLGSQALLTWQIFNETVEMLKQNGGKALKGDAMNGRLGDAKLPINSVEGYLAYKVYGKSLGDTVFRRISAISGILVWAGICVNERRVLRLA